LRPRIAAGIGAAVSLCNCLLFSPLDRHAPADHGPSSDAGLGDTTDATGACDGGRCSAITTDECPLVYGDPTDPNAVVFGAYATLGTTGVEDAGVLLDYQLALGELNAARGLPDPPGGSVHHPLVMVVCNNVPADPAMGSSFLDKSLQHLIIDLRVPAIVAYLLPDNLKYAFETYGKPHHVFFLSPIGATQSLDAEPDDDLLWHMLGQPSDLAPGYEALARLLQGYVEKTMAVSAVRVATVTTTAAFDEELAGAVTSSFDTNATFNGKTLADNAGTCDASGCQYQAFTIDATHSAADVAAQIVALAPNIIVSLADHRFTDPQTGVLPLVETSWNAVSPRPYYILSPINAGALPDVESSFAGLLSIGSPTTNRRFMGIGVAGAKDPTLYNQYISRLLSTFHAAPVDTENFYDTIYFLAYAMSSAIDRGPIGAPMTGPAIANGMRQLINGSIAYSVGPSDVGDVLRQLTVGPISLDGTMGPPDFYPDGARIDAAGVYCFDSDGRPQIQVLRYDASVSPPFVGSFAPCFSGFFP
jgi:hypothetical protein